MIVKKSKERNKEMKTIIKEDGREGRMNKRKEGTTEGRLERWE